jgi:hypothetical protein
VKVFFSERDRAAIWSRLNHAADWGGGEEELAARLEAWELLELEAFNTRKKDRKLGDKALPVEVPEQVAAHLLATLPLARNMPPDLGRGIALVMRALRKASPKGTAT